MASPQRLLFLCVTLRAVYEAKAVSLFREDHELSVAEASKQSEFYDYEGRLCKKCPPGHHVLRHCEISGTASLCQLCENNTFLKSLNAFEKCISCMECRGLDQVEVQPCTRTSDTQCACKKGSFCSPSHPCEACRKCSTSCPEGKVMVQHCTPESDIVCEKKPSENTTISSSTTSPTPATDIEGHNGLIAIYVILGIVGLLAAFGLYKCLHGNGGTPSYPMTWSRLEIEQRVKNRCLGRGQEVQDNLRNTRMNPEPPQSLTGYSGTNSETTPLKNDPAREQEDQRTERSRNSRHLVPANGEDPIDTLHRSFYIFIEKVPVPEWKQYMRALGLTSNEIEIAERNERDVREQYHQMLRMWLNKRSREASVDVLLQGLLRLGLRGVEETLRDSLIDQGLYTCG